MKGQKVSRNRQGKAVANFDRTLSSPQSDLAQDITKDPYNFDFLTLGDDAHERDMERGLLEHLRQFLLEYRLAESLLRNCKEASPRLRNSKMNWGPLPKGSLVSTENVDLDERVESGCSR